MIVDNEITRSDFEKSLKLQGLESFNSDQVSAWLNDNKKLIEKSKVEELDELEKSALDEFKVNAGSLKKVIVVEDNLEKSIVFVRPQQVDWDKDENGEILKSRAGTYKDTPENRKLGRVGQKFGGKKASESKEEESKIDENYKVTGKGTPENKKLEEKINKTIDSWSKENGINIKVSNTSTEHHDNFIIESGYGAPSELFNLRINFEDGVYEVADFSSEKGDIDVLLETKSLSRALNSFKKGKNQKVKKFIDMNPTK